MSNPTLPQQIDADTGTPVEESAALLTTDTLADSVMIFLALALLQRVVGFVRAVLFCRWLPPEQLGQWDMAFNFLMLIMPLAMLALPSCLGRYLAFYERQGHLYSFIRRTALATFGFIALTAVILLVFRGWFSEMIFGLPDQTGLVALMALTLVLVAPSLYLGELLTALRAVRLVAVTQMISSFGFAGLGITFLLVAGYQVESVVWAYALSGVLAIAAGLWLTRSFWRGWSIPDRPFAQRPFWAKVLPYIVWISLASLLANLFIIADRYMIIHYSGASPDGALAMVGQYHSGRVLPVLLISVAQTLAAMTLPHLSADWESGNIKRVQIRTRMFLKLIGFCMSAGGALCLIVAPLLFDWALGGKYNDGLAILPLTMAYAIWWALIMAAENYLLCAEKARYATAAIGFGLVLNIVLNLILLPRYGLWGAVYATATSNLIVLLIVIAINRALGCRIDRTTLVLLLVPALFLIGYLPVLIVLAILAIATGFFNRCLTHEERILLGETWTHYTGRFRRGK